MDKINDWKITKNDLKDLEDKDLNAVEDLLIEDLFQAELDNYCIDAGWYEGVKGFITFLIKDYDWDNPVIKIVSDKISDVYWSMGICMEYYERIK